MSLQVDIGKKLETMTLHTLIDIKHKQLLTYLKKIIITIIFIIFLCKYNLFSRFPPSLLLGIKNKSLHATYSVRVYYVESYCVYNTKTQT